MRNGAIPEKEPQPPKTRRAGCLNAVSVISDNDAWAVGEYGSDGGDIGMTLHWDGSSWSPVPNAAPRSTHLMDVEALAVDDVLAVGFRMVYGSPQRAFAERSGRRRLDRG